MFIFHQTGGNAILKFNDYDRLKGNFSHVAVEKGLIGKNRVMIKVIV
ncbi:MAG: hypothetical protein K0S74_177 [Chlamydiales bacterium]|jgi:hypothetical protein|nr:hypothetical protein [Chlamydiales bacterium]